MPTRRRAGTPNNQLSPPAVFYRILGYAPPGDTRRDHARAAIARTMLVKLMWENGKLTTPFWSWAAEPALAAAIQRADHAFAAMREAMKVADAYLRAHITSRTSAPTATRARTTAPCRR
jgi:hypothetical protein